MQNPNSTANPAESDFETLSLRKSKLALVLAGGGLTGAVYEIGALRAMDDLLIGRTVNDFDIYVGTSAGSLVASMLSNGISPEQMMRSLDGSFPEVQSLQRKHLFNVKRSELLRLGARLPHKVLRAWVNYVGNLTDMTFFDFVWSLLETLPAGFYDGLALGNYVQHIIDQVGYSNRFQDLYNELHIVATDLDSGERMIFDRSTPEVPISLAVAASSAVPIVYKPVRIQGHDYVDGGLRGNASLDLAIERGADLVVCINPMVPFDNQNHQSIPGETHEENYLSERGVNFIANQITRIYTHSSIRYHIKQLRRSHPEVDIILIEPKPDDYQMFFWNPMRYSARVTIAQHGFESVTYGMAAEYAAYKETLARHGIQITRRYVIEQLMRMEQSGNDTEVIRHILESRPTECVDSNRDLINCRLDQVLDELDHVLEQI